MQDDNYKIKLLLGLIFWLIAEDNFKIEITVIG